MTTSSTVTNLDTSTPAVGWLHTGIVGTLAFQSVRKHDPADSNSQTSACRICELWSSNSFLGLLSTVWRRWSVKIVGWAWRTLSPPDSLVPGRWYELWWILGAWVTVTARHLLSVRSGSLLSVLMEEQWAEWQAAWADYVFVCTINSGSAWQTWHSILFAESLEKACSIHWKIDINVNIFVLNKKKLCWIV